MARFLELFVKHSVHVVVSLLAAVACQEPATSAASSAPASGSAVSASAPARATAPSWAEPAPTQPPEAPSMMHVGAPLTPSRTAALEDVLARPKEFAGAPLIVEGLVRRACRVKGCWMELQSPDNEAQRCRITFKDYAFFVPTDSAGSHARVQGEVSTELVTAGRVEHLEREGAVFPNKRPDGSALEVRLVATGVDLIR